MVRGLFVFSLHAALLYIEFVFERKIVGWCIFCFFPLSTQIDGLFLALIIYERWIFLTTTIEWGRENKFECGTIFHNQLTWFTAKKKIYIRSNWGNDKGHVISHYEIATKEEVQNIDWNFYLLSWLNRKVNKSSCLGFVCTCLYTSLTDNCPLISNCAMSLLLRAI